jgi:hypothetical protein
MLPVDEKSVSDDRIKVIWFARTPSTAVPRVFALRYGRPQDAANRIVLSRKLVMPGLIPGIRVLAPAAPRRLALDIQK